MQLTINSSISGELFPQRYYYLEDSQMDDPAVVRQRKFENYDLLS